MRRVVARFNFLCNLIGNRPKSLTGHTANVMGNHTSRANDRFSGFLGGRFPFRADNFYAEDSSSFDSLVLREKSKNAGRQFFSLRQ